MAHPQIGTTRNSARRAGNSLPPSTDVSFASSRLHFDDGCLMSVATLLRLQWPLFVCLIMLPSLTGCAGFRPLDGIPVDSVPPELNQSWRSAKSTVDLSLLRQNPPRAYHVDAGDVLGIYIEGVLGGGTASETPPVNFVQDDDALSSTGFPVHVRDDGTISLPSVDPIDIRGLTLAGVEKKIRKTYTEDHPILRPGQERILVSLQRPRTYRVLVIRQEAGARRNTSGSPDESIETEKRGTGRVVDLPAYRNDVLTALTMTGGLPGLDAENAVYILRRGNRRTTEKAPLPTPMQPIQRRQPQNIDIPDVPETRGPSLPSKSRQTSASVSRNIWKQVISRTQPAPDPQWWTSTSERAWPAPPLEAMPFPGEQNADEWSESEADFAAHDPEEEPWCSSSPQLASAANPMSYESYPVQWPGQTFARESTIHDSHVTRIPLRVGPGEHTKLSKEDIILRDGDVVFIESREKEFFYTGGLLGGGQHILPRDYDLDLLGALSIVQTGVNNNFSGATRAIGGVSTLNQDVTVGASSAIILRKMPEGGTIPIKVDLYAMMRKPCSQQIFIQPGDHIILQYSKKEACAAFFERHLLDGLVLGMSSAALFGR